MALFNVSLVTCNIRYSQLRCFIFSVSTMDTDYHPEDKSLSFFSKPSSHDDEYSAFSSSSSYSSSDVAIMSALMVLDQCSPHVQEQEKVDYRTLPRKNGNSSSIVLIVSWETSYQTMLWRRVQVDVPYGSTTFPSFIGRPLKSSTQRSTFSWPFVDSIGAPVRRSRYSRTISSVSRLDIAIWYLHLCYISYFSWMIA